MLPSYLGSLVVSASKNFIFLNVLQLSCKNAEHIVAFLENVVVCHLNSQSYSFDKEAVEGKGASH